MEWYWLIYDGTGSVAGDSGCFLVVEGQKKVDGYISSKCTLDCVRDSAIEMINYNFSLIQSINLWWWEVGDPVSQNRSVSPLQQNS